MKCPDDGTCHHGCEGAGCFRVQACGPLSGVYPDNKWPWHIKHRPIEDWVPVHDSFLGKELRAVYCTCGSDDYAECFGKQQFDNVDWPRIKELTQKFHKDLSELFDE